MTQFRFFFFAILAFLVLCLLLSLWQFYSWWTNPILEFFPLVVLAGLALTVFSLFPIMKHFGTRVWVRVLFIPMNVAVWLMTVNILLLDIKDYAPTGWAEAVQHRLTNVVAFFALAGYVLAVVGCFCVRARPLRWGFRFLGIGLILWVLIAFMVMRGDDGGTRPSHAHVVSKALAEAMAAAVTILPLLILHYRAWKRGAADDWKAEVDTLGAETA